MVDGASRLAVAAHPVTVGALVLLVLNDHVLKGWSGGVEGVAGTVARTATGKLSDLAGVLLLAVWLGALVGRRRAVVAAVGLGFVALKLSPLVAEAAVPLLGGRTRTDPSDLLALVALVPADRILRPVEDLPRRDLGVAWASLRSTLGLAVVVLSVPAMTATSPCDDEPPVGLTTIAVVDDGTLVTWDGLREDRSDPGPGPTVPLSTPDEYWTSDDGGRTWREEEPEPAVLDEARDGAGGDVACTDEGCFRRADDGVIEEDRGDGWETSFGYSRRHRARMDANQTACGPDLTPTIGQLVATADGTVVATAGRYGVVRRPPGGDWEHVSVGTWREPSTLPAAWPRHLKGAPYVAAIAYVLLFWLSIRRNPRRSALRPLSAFLALLGAILCGGLGLFVYAASQGGGSERDDGVGIGLLTGVPFVLAVLPLVPLLLGYARDRAPSSGSWWDRDRPPPPSQPPMGEAPPPPRPGPPERYPGDPGPPPPPPSGWI